MLGFEEPTMSIQDTWRYVVFTGGPALHAWVGGWGALHSLAGHTPAKQDACGLDLELDSSVTGAWGVCAIWCAISGPSALLQLRLVPFAWLVAPGWGMGAGWKDWSGPAAEEG